jgi:predicted transcriptional regulator of viral defense system
MKNNASTKALSIFRANNGILHTRQALDLGIAPRTLYQLRDEGALICESRGIFRLSDSEISAQHDLVHVALSVPRGVICLISALAFYELTTQIPHQVYLALPVDGEKPRLAYPPVRLFWLSPRVYSAGVEERTIEGVSVKIYSMEKTIMDCFKFRNKLGLDVALEGLRAYQRRGEFIVVK